MISRIKGNGFVSKYTLNNKGVWPGNAAVTDWPFALEEETVAVAHWNS